MFDIFRLIQSDLVAVVPASDPLSEKESVTYMDLNNRDMILFQRDETSAAQLDIDYKDSESRPKIIFSSSQWHMVFDLVELGLGLTIAPYYIFERLKRPELKALPIKEESSKRTIALIAKRDDNRSKALRTFIEFASNRELYDDITDMLTL